MIDSGPRDWDEQSYAHDERPLFPRAAEDRFENQMMQAEDAKLKLENGARLAIWSRQTTECCQPGVGLLSLSLHLLYTTERIPRKNPASRTDPTNNVRLFMHQLPMYRHHLHLQTTMRVVQGSSVPSIPSHARPLPSFHPLVQLPTNPGSPLECDHFDDGPPTTTDSTASWPDRRQQGAARWQLVSAENADALGEKGGL
ncbi:hypothetical protein EV126DRAFT_33211 [Verticillium dahliae]|nr:hypothetical protein EV126DRAFT_33211 [Verticillium dahliae]